MFKIKRNPKDIKVAWWFLLVTLLLGFAIFWAWHEYMTTPPYVDREQFPVRGFDISSHNGYANLDAAAKGGYEFIFIKASEGTDFRDPNFVLNYQKAGHAGLKRGAYHFFRFDKDGVEQAKNLLRVIGPRQLELGIVVDVEEHGNATGVSDDLVRQRLQRMLEYLNLRGHRVMFYTNQEGQERYLTDGLEGFPLWLCAFTDMSGRGDWTFWQYDHHGKVPGIRGDVDLDVFRGSRAEWEKYLGN